MLNDPRSVAERKVNDQLSQGSTCLILENTKLQDLSFLNRLSWDNLQDIDLHKNYLSSIDVLNQFRNLKSIKASDNYLVEINLNLQRLEELDLHNNYINKFPVITPLNKIQRINLNANKIEDMRVDFKPPSSLSLQQLDLGNNKLDFISNEEFQHFIERLKKLKNLKYLIIMIDENKCDQLIVALTQLEMFNNEKADEYRRKVQEVEKKSLFGKGKDKPNDKAKGKSKVDKTKFYFPTLELLCYNLEAANSHHSYALDHLRDLSQDVDKICDHLEMVDVYFVAKRAEGVDEETEQQHIHDMIEDFMQNSQLLFNNQPELQNIMLTILSKLSIIKFSDFGIRCFNTLKDLMIAGKDMEDRVIETIKQEVINKLQQTNPEMIPASLLQGLHELVDLTGKTEILSGLFENCFPSWLRILLERVFACRKIAAIYENNTHFDSIIALMHVSLRDSEENVEKAVSKELVPIISEILNDSTWEQERYIDLLKIVEKICYVDPEAAAEFIKKQVHLNLIKFVNTSLTLYSKNNDLKEEGSGEKDEIVMKKYLTLSAEIDCLGGLLEAEEKSRKVIIEAPELVKELLKVTTQQKIDPILLTSICKFARQYFSRDEIKGTEQQLQENIAVMQKLIPLIPYLGMKKYEDAVKMARKYHDVAAIVDRDKIPPPSMIEDTIIHDLFISIINLINFFCEESDNEKVAMATIQDVSDALNENGREAGLFICLEVPSDEVKLAVVECLNNVPLSEFDTEEIENIIRLLGFYKNIGAGKTELVLAKIFWILTKLTKDKENDSGKTFRMRFGEKAVLEATDILVRNLMRPLDDPDEEVEKLALSLSGLHFLKYASSNAEMKKHMLNKHDMFKLAFYADQQNTSYEMMFCPVELEETTLGSSMDVLLHAISGNDSIDPYNYVSFRLLQKMADVLMNKDDSELVDPFYPQAEDVFKFLEKHYKDKFAKRLAYEKLYWEDPEEDFLPKMQANEDSFNHFVKQHNHFTMNNGIPILRMFLTKKVIEFEQFLKKEYDMAYDKSQQILDKNLKQLKEKTEFKEHEHQKFQEDNKGKSNWKDQDSDEKGLDILRMALQAEELGQYYNPKKAQDHLLQTSMNKPAVMESIIDRDYKIGVQNMELR